MYITPPVALTAVSQLSDSSNRISSSNEHNSASSGIWTRSAGAREISSTQTIGTRSYNIEGSSSSSSSSGVSEVE